MLVTLLCLGLSSKSFWNESQSVSLLEKNNTSVIWKCWRTFNWWSAFVKVTFPNLVWVCLEPVCVRKSPQKYCGKDTITCVNNCANLERIKSLKNKGAFWDNMWKIDTMRFLSRTAKTWNWTRVSFKSSCGTLFVVKLWKYVCWTIDVCQHDEKLSTNNNYAQNMQNITYSKHGKL